VPRRDGASAVNKLNRKQRKRSKLAGSKKRLRRAHLRGQNRRDPSEFE
jgi:hypothetical protein